MESKEGIRIKKRPFSTSFRDEKRGTFWKTIHNYIATTHKRVSSPIVPTQILCLLHANHTLGNAKPQGASTEKSFTKAVLVEESKRKQSGIRNVDKRMTHADAVKSELNNSSGCGNMQEHTRASARPHMVWYCIHAYVCDHLLAYKLCLNVSLSLLLIYDRWLLHRMGTMQITCTRN